MRIFETIIGRLPDNKSSSILPRALSEYNLNDMRKSIIALSVFFLLFSCGARAQFRKYSNEFLNIGAGARGLGMGSAQVASVNDATAGYWNPAGLAEVKNNPSATLMHAEYFSGIAKYDYAAAAVPIQDNKRTVGFSLLRFAVDDIPNTLFLVEPDGSINYNNIQTFSSADYAFLLSVSQKIKETDNWRMNAGVNAKVIYRKVGKFATAWGFGLDAGVQMRSEKWSLGLVAKDLTSTFNAWTFKFTDREKEALYLTKNDIPVRSTELTAPRLVLGGAYDFRISKSLKLQAEANIDLTFDGKRNTVLSGNTVSADPHLGLEASIKDVFFVRGGITNFQRALSDGDTTNQKKVWIYQPSLGAGFKIKKINLDYAFTNLANQSNPLYTHVISLRFGFGKNDDE